MVSRQINVEALVEKLSEQSLDKAGLTPAGDLIGDSPLSENGAMNDFVDGVDDKTSDANRWTGNRTRQLRRQLSGVLDPFSIKDFVTAQSLLLPVAGPERQLLRSRFD